MTTARLCQCPAIKSTRFCVNHSDDLQRRRNLAKARQLKRARDGADRPLDALNAEIFESLELPALEEAADIAVVLSNTTRLLGGGHISTRKAEAIITACRIAGVNLRALGSQGGADASLKGGIRTVKP
jgi:hypothetical protein